MPGDRKLDEQDGAATLNKKGTQAGAAVCGDSLIQADISLSPILSPVLLHSDTQPTTVLTEETSRELPH